MSWASTSSHLLDFSNLSLSTFACDFDKSSESWWPQKPESFAYPSNSTSSQPWSAGWLSFESDSAPTASSRKTSVWLPAVEHGIPQPGALGLPDIDYFSPSSPSDASSDLSSFTPPPPPEPQVEIIQCAAPLLAPKPLPYHSPTFLQFEKLPSMEDDLSYAPFTHRPVKRKRGDSSEEDEASVGAPVPHKRRISSEGSFNRVRQAYPSQLVQRAKHYHSHNRR